MKNLIFRLRTFLAHTLKAKDEHSIHSPYLFRFYLNCIKNNDQYYVFKKIETFRKLLLQDSDEIEIQDFGTGGKKNNEYLAPISNIAKNSLSTTHQAQALFKIANYSKANTIVELGTSFGISTAYLATPNSKACVYTFEGSSKTLQIAKGFHQEIGLKNIQHTLGNIDNTYPDFLTKTKPKIDILYIDANHTFEACIRYFNLAIPYLHNDSIIIIDDIYWSKEMTRAWHTIIETSPITISMDYYEYGLLFFRKEQRKQHFVLKTA